MTHAMAEPHVAPYGSWHSPITADAIVAGTVSLGQIACDGDDIYWTETRPAESGRGVLVRRTSDGATSDLTPAPFNVRTRVHEYGGGAFAVVAGTVVFSHFADGRLYQIGPEDQSPRPITPDVALRYADVVIDRRRDRLVAVREDHRGDGEAVNTIVAVALAGADGGGDVLVDGADFYSSPCLSPNGDRLAWLSWNHPNMPWDGSELWAAPVTQDGSLGTPERVAGGPDESIFQPQWSPDGLLHFVSDRSGWWNLYRSRAGTIDALCPMEAEFGLPQWVFGMSTSAFLAADRLACAFTAEGTWRLAILDTGTGSLTPVAVPDDDIGDVRAGNGRIVYQGGAPDALAAIVAVDPKTGRREVLQRSGDLAIDPGNLSSAEPIAFPTTSGLTAYGFFYPPINGAFRGPTGELPPLLVQSHGGPTGATETTLDPSVQYWTSRGFAVLDVNYGGSTGYGRAYRQRLNDRWGIVDVDDCGNGARYLAEQGLVDPERLIIRGWSASGYTTLAALTFRDQFKAGASHFGISDLETMARDTHKFESRYLDGLIGPYPERQDIYRERSPIHFTDRLSAPMILFQGLEDKVVPPDQAETMYEAVRAKGLPVAYVPFEGEQHGFRRSENIKRALEAELFFYSRVFGFDLAESIEPIPIANLDAAATG